MARQKNSGNSMGEAQEYAQQLIKAAEQIMRFERVVVDEGVSGTDLRDIRLKAPKEGSNEWLVIIRIDYEGSPMVAFSTATSMLEALRLTTTRYLNGDLKWKDDSYGNK